MAQEVEGEGTGKVSYKINVNFMPSWASGALIVFGCILLTLKLAGVIAWPWLAVLLPMVIALAPLWVMLAAGIASIALVVGAFVLTMLGLFGVWVYESCQRWNRRRRHRRQQRTAG